MVLNARLDALDAADLLVLSAVLEYGRQAHPSSALTMEMFFFFLVECRHEVQFRKLRSEEPYLFLCPFWEGGIASRMLRQEMRTKFGL